MADSNDLLVKMIDKFDMFHEDAVVITMRKEIASYNEAHVSAFNLMLANKAYPLSKIATVYGEYTAQQLVDHGFNPALLEYNNVPGVELRLFTMKARRLDADPNTSSSS